MLISQICSFSFLPSLGNLAVPIQAYVGIHTTVQWSGLWSSALPSAIWCRFPHCLLQCLPRDYDIGGYMRDVHVICSCYQICWGLGWCWDCGLKVQVVRWHNRGGRQKSVWLLRSPPGVGIEPVVYHWTASSCWGAMTGLCNGTTKPSCPSSILLIYPTSYVLSLWAWNPLG